MLEFARAIGSIALVQHLPGRDDEHQRHEGTAVLQVRLRLDALSAVSAIDLCYVLLVILGCRSSVAAAGSCGWSTGDGDW